MEIGSFIELQFPKGKEFYNQSSDIARLNTGRNAIYHAFRVSGTDAIWLPIYQCDTVKDALLAKGVSVKYYHIDKHFNPIDLRPSENESALFVNYYGIMSYQRMLSLSKLCKHPIIDNCQAFFSKPIDNALNVYSCRKFIGVPDGSYVIGKHAGDYVSTYPQGYSSDTSAFLLMRIEYGCEGKGYQARSINEQRVDSEDIKKMSKLTFSILDGTDYDFIQKKRRENFEFAHRLLGTMNQLNPLENYADGTIPMVYPLVVERDELLSVLQEAKHFQGHWWSYICEEQPSETFESWLSRYVIPITIDQRYGLEEIQYLADLIKKNY